MKEKYSIPLSQLAKEFSLEEIYVPGNYDSILSCFFGSSRGTDRRIRLLYALADSFYLSVCIENDTEGIQEHLALFQH